jgi:hypothetical protein
MCCRMALLILVGGVLAARTHEVKTPAEARGENESVVLNATLYSTPEAVHELLGSDLGGHYIVVALEVTPRFGKQVTISRDDFMLKTDKDGEKSTPFAPSQIAGRGVLVISESAGGSSAMHNNSGPIWGGYPGMGGIPSRAGGNGTGTSEPETAQAKTRSGAKEDPILGVLKQKELPQTTTDHPVSGLLYFPMEKQKVKDLELRYNMPEDKIVMRFRQPH